MFTQARRLDARAERVSINQMKMLVEELEANGQYLFGANCFNRRKKEKIWEMIAGKLNALGPATKRTENWKKVSLNYISKNLSIIFF